MDCADYADRIISGFYGCVAGRKEEASSWVNVGFVRISVKLWIYRIVTSVFLKMRRLRWGKRKNDKKELTHYFTVDATSCIAGTLQIQLNRLQRR